MQSRTRLAGAVMVAMMICWSSYAQTSYGQTSYVQGSAARAERELFASVNDARRAQGLSQLRWNESLAVAARRHAAVMAEQGTAQHAFEGEPSLSVRVKQAGVPFSWLSENVTQGPTAIFIHAQFMHSAAHRANIVDRDMDSVGIGVAEQGGQLFAVEDFAQVR